MGLLGDKGYLRVTTPQTTDGNNLRYADDGSGRVIKKETHLPLTAKKYLVAENDGMPQHLRHTIEEVLEETPAKIRNKPGPKPKPVPGDATETPEDENI